MSNSHSNIMSPMHISKLGHEIEEIRNRALKSIYSKYTLQLVDEANVENNKNLVDNLLNWFNFENRPDEDKALRLLLRVARTENFDVVVQSLDGDLLLERLKAVETKTDSCNLSVISEIKDLILGVKRKKTHPVITELVIGVPEEEVCQEIIYLPWQSLSKADKQILESTFEGLRYLDNTTAVILACQFLNDIILQDFPSEVFLQRPLVLHTLLEMINTRLFTTPTPVLKSLLEISDHLHVRIKRLFDWEVRGKRWGDHVENFEDEEDLTRFQLTISGFCERIFDKLGPFLERDDNKNLAVSLVLRCVMIQGIANSRSSIPNIFEQVLAREKCKPIYNTLLTAMLLWLRKPSDLSLNLRQEIFGNIGDPGLLYFFPELHDLLLNLVVEFRDQEAEQLVKDYEDCLKICASMDAAKKLETNLEMREYFDCMLRALPSFEFHRNSRVVEEFVKKCGNFRGDFKDMVHVLVRLLARDDVGDAVYRAVHCWVLKYVGDEFCTDKLEFLCDRDVWKEMWMFGSNSRNQEVQRNCQEILSEILKAQHPKFLTSLQSSFSLMSAYAGNKTPLGRAILRTFDPTVSLITKTDLLHGNIRLMFCKEIDVNEEGFARLCWLLAQDDPSAKKLPKVADIKGLHLSSMCVSVKPSTVQNLPQFSTSRALNETMTALKTPAMTTNDRKRVLDKLSTILCDASLQGEFLEANGLELMLTFLEKALIERDLSVYPTSVFPLMSIFKNLAVNHGTVRQSLVSKDSFILNALRSLLLFTADEVFRQNAVGLLFMLVYNDQILEVSTAQKLSLPEIITKNMHVPISVQTHAKISLHSTSNRLHLMGNALLSRTLRVHWATVCMGGIENITALSVDDLSKDIFSPNLPSDMLLKPLDLLSLQAANPRTTLLAKLQAIDSADSHDCVYENIEQLISCLTWLETWKALPPCGPAHSAIDSLPWQTVLERFLTTLPKSIEDEALLGRLVSLLRSLLRTTDNPDLVLWIRGLLTNPMGVFVDLLKSLGKSVHELPGRELRYGIVHLAQELIQMDGNSEPGPWIALAVVVNEYLDTNLADHLDCFLGLLADITGTWTWDYAPYEKLYKNVITRVIEVIVSFKGVAKSEDSFMGSNIINNSLLILGHMLCDASTNTQGWERLWEEAMRQAVGVENLLDADYSWLLTLVHYRDPVTRASALTLLSGLFASTKAYHLLVDGLDMGMGHIWATALAIITDKNECALVREKAAVLLERLTTLGSRTDCSDFLLYIKSEGIYDKISDIIGSQKHSRNVTDQITTNRLITALSNWIFTVLELNKTLVAQHIVESSLMNSLIQILADRDSTGDDWPAMAASITRLIRASVKASPTARDILLTSNRVQSVATLLTTPGEENFLKYLRLECFYLLAVLLETEKGIAIFQNSLPVDKEAFLEAIVEAVSSPFLRKRVLVLINNLARPGLRQCFACKLENGCFGEAVCEKLLLVDLAECAETLASVFLISPQAQALALQRNCPQKILNRIKKLSSELCAYPVSDFRKPSIRKKLEPVLQQLEANYKLAANFCFKNVVVKTHLAEIGLADAVHKLWSWYNISSKLRKVTLKMLCTLSFNSEPASQAIALASGPSSIRKGSLIQSITQLITKEMDQLTKISDTCDLTYCLQILSNCCIALECRFALAKGTILAPLVKLLPSENKKRNYSDDVLEIWLHFLNAFTAHPEGQLCVSKDTTAAEFIFVMASSPNPEISKTALSIIFHLSLHPQNRCRLLSKPAPLLNLLLTVLKSENEETIRLSAATLWALAANSQKAKILLRSAGSSDAVQQAMQHCERPEILSTLQRTLRVISEK